MSRFKNWLFPPVSANELVRRDMRSMLPGMLIEQVAATLLDNINIVVMGFIGNEATAGVSQVSTINNTMMIVVQFFAMGGTALVAQAAGAGNAREGRRVAGDALALGTALSLAAALLLTRLSPTRSRTTVLPRWPRRFGSYISSAADSCAAAATRDVPWRSALPQTR